MENFFQNDQAFPFRSRDGLPILAHQHLASLHLHKVLGLIVRRGTMRIQKNNVSGSKEWRIEVEAGNGGNGRESPSLLLVEQRYSQTCYLTKRRRMSI